MIGQFQRNLVQIKDQVPVKLEDNWVIVKKGLDVLKFSLLAPLGWFQLNMTQSIFGEKAFVEMNGQVLFKGKIIKKERKYGLVIHMSPPEMIGQFQFNFA